MLVRDLKANLGNNLPQEFLNCLPEYCFDSHCKAPLEISETLTSLRCSNPRCPSKVAKRINGIANMLGVKDLGEARTLDFVYKFNVQNPLAIFSYVPDEDGTIGNSVNMDISKRIYDQFQSKNSFTLSEYVKIANLPYIQSSSLSLFGDFDNLDDAYSAIERGGVDYVREKLNISKGYSDSGEVETISVRATKVFTVLIEYKQDLIQALPYVKIIKTNEEHMRKLKAVCSEEVGSPFKTKADFYATANNLYQDKIHIEFLSAVNKSIDYLIWAGADGKSGVRVTNKVMKVRGYNNAYNEHKANGTLKDGEHYIPIVTALEFISKLKELSGEE